MTLTLNMFVFYTFRAGHRGLEGHLTVMQTERETHLQHKAFFFFFRK